MNLRKAIQRVAKVCPRKKEKANFQVIRFLPAQHSDSAPSSPPYVYATDGLRSALVKVDLDDLPNVLLPAADLVKAAKDPGDLEVVETGYGKVELRTQVSVYQLQGLDLDYFPPVPAPPAQYHQVENWNQVTKVFHAAASDKEPELAVVHFTPEYVEATDKARLVRVEVPGQWDGLVPVGTFKMWPRGDVWAAFTTTHAFFWIGDELRIGSLLTNPNYPKMAAVVPANHVGPYIVVPTQGVQEAAIQGAALSELGMVTLEITDRLIMRAWQEKSEDSSGYESEIRIYDGSGNEGMLLITGKHLDEALRPVETLNVKLGFGSVSDPLRIESGIYTALVWQLVYS